MTSVGSYQYSYDSPYLHKRPSFLAGGDDDTEGDSFVKWGDEEAFLTNRGGGGEKITLSPVSEMPIEEEEFDKDDDQVTLFDMIESGVPAPPDGGYGWVIVFVSFMCNLMVDGIVFTFGLFLPFLATDLDEPKGSVAWVSSILIGMYLATGPFVSALTNKFGCRPVCFSGGIVAFIGFSLSSLSTNLSVMILTYGIIGGLGLGLIYLPAIVSVGYYFEKRRALANGIAVSGSGIGTFLFNPLANWLIKITDWRNSNIVFAGIALTTCLFALLLKPLEIKRLDDTECDDDFEAQDNAGLVKKPKRKNLLQRMAEDRKRYFDKDSMSGSSYFVVQLPDGTFEKRQKIPIDSNADPGVHSSLHLDQLYSGTPAAQSYMTPAPLPTITEAKVTGGENEKTESSIGINLNGNIEEVKEKEEEKGDSKAEKKPEEDTEKAVNRISESDPDKGEKDSINMDILDGEDDGPIRKIDEDTEEEDGGEDEDLDLAQRLTASNAIPIKRKISRERRYSEGVSSPTDHLTPTSSYKQSEMFGKSPSRSAMRGGGGGRTPAPPIPIPGSIPRNGSAPQFMAGRGIPKNTSVPFFDRMPRKSSYKAVPSSVGVNVGLFKRNNSIKSNLGGDGGESRRGSASHFRTSISSFVGSRNNNVGGHEDDTNSIWSKYEMSDGIFFSSSRKSTQGESVPRQIIRPLSRKDVFYAGSINHLPEYQSQRSIATYRQSILNIPKELGLDAADGIGGIGIGGGDADTSSIKKKPLICPCLASSAGAFQSILSQLLDFSLLKNPVFLFIALSNMFSMLGFYVPYIYIIDAAVAKDIDRDSAGYFISIIGIVNTIGRIASGIISDRPEVNSLFFNNLCLLFSGIAVALVPFCSSFMSYTFFAIAFGLFVAGFVTVTSIVIVDLLGLDKLTNAFGLLMLFRGAAGVVGAPMAGAVFEAFQSYDVPFFLAGACLIISALISFAIPFITQFGPPKPILAPRHLGAVLEDIPEDPAEFIQSSEESEQEKEEKGDEDTTNI